MPLGWWALFPGTCHWVVLPKVWQQLELEGLRSTILKLEVTDRLGVNVFISLLYRPCRYIGSIAQMLGIFLCNTLPHLDSNLVAVIVLPPSLCNTKRSENVSYCLGSIIWLQAFHVLQQVLVHHQHCPGLNTSPNSTRTDSTEPSSQAFRFVDEPEASRDRRDI